MKKVLAIIMIMLVMMSSIAFAGYDEISTNPGAPSSAGSLQAKATGVLGVIQWVGYIVAIGMLIWVGIKYVTSGAGEKAKAKETLIPIVIGAVLIAGATWIAQFIFNAV